MLWGNYPMTQIYQHEEDVKRGDITLSVKLGIKGTFLFTAILFSIASTGFVFYFTEYYQIKYALVFLLALSPVLAYFVYWFSLVRRDEGEANHMHTMRLNFISATCLNAFFIWFFLDSSQVLQALIKGY
jgi:1,4-dihydroxy-2-naphthoate octaprenyltransferase